MREAEERILTNNNLPVSSSAVGPSSRDVTPTIPSSRPLLRGTHMDVETFQSQLPLANERSAQWRE